MAGDVQSLDEARRARLAGADAEGHRSGFGDADQEGLFRRAAAATVYVTRAEEALVMLSDAGDDLTRDAFRRITESWLELATAELSTLQHPA